VSSDSAVSLYHILNDNFANPLIVSVFHWPMLKASLADSGLAKSCRVSRESPKGWAIVQESRHRGSQKMPDRHQCDFWCFLVLGICKINVNNRHVLFLSKKESTTNRVWLIPPTLGMKAAMFRCNSVRCRDVVFGASTITPIRPEEVKNNSSGSSVSSFELSSSVKEPSKEFDNHFSLESLNKCR